VAAGLRRELAADLASKTAWHLFSMAMTVLGITPLNRKEKKGENERAFDSVLYHCCNCSPD
jgi:hypothetical protein